MNMQSFVYDSLKKLPAPVKHKFAVTFRRALEFSRPLGGAGERLLFSTSFEFPA